MKIVNKKEFLKLPKGIVYCKTDSDYNENNITFNFGEIYIKEDTIIPDEQITGSPEPKDWRYKRLNQFQNNGDGDYFDRFEEMVATSKSYPLEIDTCRDGMFCGNDLFLIYEKDDLVLLINTLLALFKSMVCS